MNSRSLHQMLKHAFLLTLVEVVENGVEGRENLRQHARLTTCSQYVHDAIHNVSERVLSVSVLRIMIIFGNLPMFISMGS